MLTSLKRRRLRNAFVTLLLAIGMVWLLDIYDLSLGRR